MKKVFLSLALVIGLTGTQVNAQTLSGGIKAEGNMSNFLLRGMNSESKVGFGATIGGYGKFSFGENFALQPEVLLHFKNSEIKSTTTSKSMDFQYFGVEIPVYAIGYANIGNGKGYVGIGPYAGFGIDARYITKGASDVDLYEYAMQRWDFGGGAMLGYEFSNKLQINASYKLGFMNALNNVVGDTRMLNQTVSLGLGYRF